MATEEELRWLKKEFVAACKTTPADVRALPTSQAGNCEQLEATRARSVVPSANRTLSR